MAKIFKICKKINFLMVRTAYFTTTSVRKSVDSTDYLSQGYLTTLGFQVAFLVISDSCRGQHSLSSLSLTSFQLI